MSANYEILTKEAGKRIKQLEHIKGKFDKLKRTDAATYAPTAYAQEVEKDAERIRSNLKVARDVYDDGGLLTDAVTRRFCDFFRALVVYDEITCEIRQLHDCVFGTNLTYLFLNPEKKCDKDAELAYLASNPSEIPLYVTRQRTRIHSSTNARHVTIDESLPYDL